MPGLDAIPHYWITIVLYETNKDLHRAMAKHGRYSIKTISDVGGCWTEPDKPGHNGYLGILRLSSEHLSVDTIIHESVHVAVTLARTYFDVDPLRLPSQGPGSREELLAYATAPLATALIEKLRPLHYFEGQQIDGESKPS
ncbi:hypothetical protein JGU71_28260 [Antrihabitans sp. YC3-6]|uniref:Uncharacterized protein n=1 Tax=Antrihabitans stalagmiti TaxID=2799499 RepID=A0A934NWW1_9NOCA|nr:hypothetical protein [Antrihabitans stalagmiti]MBJ8342790.1 hypothetical protein [Antrihabitans stalagmiti]